MYYRIFYFIRNRLRTFLGFHYSYVKECNFNHIINNASWLNSYKSFNESKFTFLNQSVGFSSEIDWNYHNNGKLWTYNLNYFDFLLQEDITMEQGLFLISDYIDKIEISKEGIEPYPLSLKGINWIKFLSKYRIENKRINSSLYVQYHILLDNLEYHILGNHLLENGFSLLFAGYYFKNKKFYKEGKKILERELEEQILNDGGHFEKSPMYHQIMFLRVLDSVNLINNNKDIFFNITFLHFLIEKAGKMLSWLKEITFKNGEIPNFNDSTSDIAPTSKQLYEYANSLKIPIKKNQLNDSGFRKIVTSTYEIAVSLGEIKASYQPGHSHSDIFTYCLNIDNHPIIVDTGISTYESNNIRKFERSTNAHNTVVINNQNQSQVWSSFRVGKRAKIINFTEEQNKLSITHNGYKKHNTLHKRDFKFSNNLISINDYIDTKKLVIAKSYIHFHPQVSLTHQDNYIKSDFFKIEFKNYNSIVIDSYNFAKGFNQLIKAPVVIIDFSLELKTLIKIIEN